MESVERTPGFRRGLLFCVLSVGELMRRTRHHLHSRSSILNPRSTLSCHDRPAKLDVLVVPVPSGPSGRRASKRLPAASADRARTGTQELTGRFDGFIIGLLTSPPQDR